jgi:hypothetical protein
MVDQDKGKGPLASDAVGSEGSAAARKEDNAAWDAFCAAVKKEGSESGEVLLGGAITAKRINGIFEAFAERVIAGASVFKEEVAKEAYKQEGRLRVQAEAHLEKALREQSASIEAKHAKALAAKDKEKEAKEDAHKVELANRDEEIDKAQKLKVKIEKANQKAQSSLKIALLRQEKADAEIERMHKEVRGKAEKMMLSLFTELELSFDVGQTPAEMFKALVARHEAEVKELTSELNEKKKLIDKMRVAAESGNHDIIGERDKLEVERDRLAEEIKTAKAAKVVAEKDTAAMRKENKDVHAAAKAAARGEIETLQQDVAVLQDSEQQLEATVAKLEGLLENVQIELAACAKELRVAQAAGKHGGYYFSAGTVNNAAATARIDHGSPMRRHSSSPTLRGYMTASSGALRGSKKRSSKESVSARKGEAMLASERRRAPSPTGITMAADGGPFVSEGSPRSPEGTRASKTPSSLSKSNPGGLFSATFSVKLAEGAKRQGLSLTEVGAAAAAAAKQKQQDGGAGSLIAHGTKKKKVAKKKSMTERQPRASAAVHERVREPTERC